MFIWGEENTKACWVIMINSLVYFLLAYFFLIILTNLSSIFFAKLSGFDATLYYYGFFLDLGTKGWDDNSIFGVFLIGPGITLLTGVIFEKLYREKRKYITHIKLFYLWGFIISYSFFFGNIIVGAFFNFGIGVVFRALSIPFIVRILIAVISIVALILKGKYSAWHILISFNSYFIQINPIQIRSLLNTQILVPFYFGNVIIFLLKIPHQEEFYFLDSLVLLCLAFFIIPLYITNKQIKTVNFKRKNKRFEFQVKPFVLLLILILLFRIGLSYGLTI